MLRDIRKNKIFNRRALILGAAQSGLTGVLILRLGYLQLWKHDEYATQSDSNRIKPLIKPAARGTIFDRSGFPMTKNEGNFRLFLYLDKRRSGSDIIAKLAEVLGLTESEKEILLDKVKNSRRKSIVSLIDSLGWDDLARIETNSHLLPGVSIESGVIRRYPYPDETAHFIGYVSLPSEKEIDDNDPALFMHPDFRIGKSGLEKTFDEALRGKYGVKYVEVDVHEVPLRTLSNRSMVEGLRINTTIDFRLQRFVTERIKNDVASVVVMDVKTGEILSYASSPTFDPNNFVEGISKEYWQQLNEDSRKPLSNKPISALYPPGSTFKLMVALAALESGFNPATRFHCDGIYHLGRHPFRCWRKEGHGSLDLVGAIMNSCNVYFFNVANQIGYERFSEMARRFGYGEKVDISLYGSKSGLVPSGDWKQKVFKQPWVGGDTMNSAIGQGMLLATPIQMALVTARIANGGIPIKPYLIRNHNIFKQYDQLKDQPLVQEKNLKIIHEGMYRVINEPGGTAYGKRIPIKDFEMSGKTGTSQVISKREDEMSKGEYSNYANHALFVGFAPSHDPKYAISVVVEHGGGGSASAAPIAKDVMMELESLYRNNSIESVLQPKDNL